MVGVKEEFLILLFKRMLGLEKGAFGSKIDVSEAPCTGKGLEDLTGPASKRSRGWDKLMGPI